MIIFCNNSLRPSDMGSLFSESFPTPIPASALRWFRVETWHPANEEAEVSGGQVTCTMLPLDSHQDLSPSFYPFLPQSSPLASLHNGHESRVQVPKEYGHGECGGGCVQSPLIDRWGFR